MKRITLCILIFALKANAQNFQLESNWWQPNGKVNTMVKDTTNNLLYVGGKFDYVGPNTPFASVINDVSGLVDINFPKSNGKVKTVVSDGRGGWFLGGDFTKIDGFERLRIAHVNSIGNVSNLFDKKGFNKSVNAFSLKTIFCMLVAILILMVKLKVLELYLTIALP